MMNVLLGPSSKNQRLEPPIKGGLPLFLLLSVLGSDLQTTSDLRSKRLIFRAGHFFHLPKTVSFDGPRFDPHPFPKDSNDLSLWICCIYQHPSRGHDWTSRDFFMASLTIHWARFQGSGMLYIHMYIYIYVFEKEMKQNSCIMSVFLLEYSISNTFLERLKRIHANILHYSVSQSVTTWFRVFTPQKHPHGSLSIFNSFGQKNVVRP